MLFRSLARYFGPPGYPLRFLYRLLGDRDIAGAWVRDHSGAWRGFVINAPDAANGVDRVSEGDTLYIILQ